MSAPNLPRPSPIVAKLPLPLPLTGIEKVVADLAREHGPDLTLRRHGDAFIVLAGPMPALDCWCGRCEREVIDALALVGITQWGIFVTCSSCGNKRCPRASWHEYQCTGSNEPGQVATYPRPSS